MKVLKFLLSNWLTGIFFIICNCISNDTVMYNAGLLSRTSSALPSLPSFHSGGNALCLEQMTRGGPKHCHMVVHAGIARGRADSTALIPERWINQLLVIGKVPGW